MSRRSGGEIDSDMNIFLCSGCSFNLSASGYAQLCDGQGDVAIGCSHILCTMCFGRAHAERGSDVKLQCRRAHCAYRTMTWIIFTPMTNNRSGDITRWSQEEQSIEIPSSSKRHPNVFFQHQEDWFRKVHTIFSAVTTDESSPGNSYIYAVNLRNDNKNQELSDESICELQQLGKLLHPCLRPPLDHDVYQSSTCAFSGKHSIEQVEREDRTPIKRFIYALATGKQYVELNDDGEANAFEQRTRNIVCLATDLIRTASGGGRQGSPVKDLLSNMINTANVPRMMHQLFSSIGVSRSITHINLGTKKAVDDIIKVGWDPKGKGYGLVIQAFDNMGMRKRAGYKQYTLLCRVIVPAVDLIKLKVYPDPHRTDHSVAVGECLSRERKSWDDVKGVEADDQERLGDFFEFTITKEDGNLMASEVVMPHIQYVLQVMSDKDNPLPTQEVAKVMIEQKVFSNQKISRGATGRVSRVTIVDESSIHSTSLDIDEDRVDELIDELEDELADDIDVPIRPSKSMFDANNAEMDIPWQLDLNCKEVVKMILVVAEQIRRKCLEMTGDQDSAGSDDDGDAEMEDDTVTVHRPTAGDHWAHWPVQHRPLPYMAIEGNYNCGDGSPTYAGLRLIREDPDLRGINIRPFNGGFHTMLELYRLCGSMFGSTHLMDIFREWRPTEGQLKWVMNPGDPNQVEEEIVMFYFGAVASAVHVILQKRREQNNDDVSVSAAEVHTFMKQAAQASPIVQNIYNQIRFVEVIFMIQQAEEEGCGKKFVTALKFASCLFASAHATKYCEIAAEFLMWWHCASEAEKKVFEKCIMVRKTRAGKTIYTDRWVEWIIKGMREGVGKHFKRGADDKIRNQALLLALKTEFVRPGTTHSDGPTTRKLGWVYCLTLLYFLDHNIWSLDRDLTRLNIEADKPQMNPEMIDMAETGMVRMDTFITNNYKADTIQCNDVKNSELLKRIEPTTMKQTNNDNINLQRSVSTKVSDVEKLYNANELKAAYSELKTTWKDVGYNENEFPKVTRNKKSVYAEAICEVRRKIILKDSNWETDTKQRIQQAIEERDTVSTDMISQRMERIGLSNFFHLGTNNTRILHNFSTKFSMNPTTESTVNNNEQASAQPNPLLRFVQVFKGI